jgi:hypothetical protein
VKRTTEPISVTPSYPRIADCALIKGIRFGVPVSEASPKYPLQLRVDHCFIDRHGFPSVRRFYHPRHFPTNHLSSARWPEDGDKHNVAQFSKANCDVDEIAQYDLAGFHVTREKVSDSLSEKRWVPHTPFLRVRV